MNTYTSRDDECLAYLSALVTVELCAEIHAKAKPNTAIRQCVGRLLPRLADYPRVFAIFLGLQRQALPSGCLHHLRRMLEEMIDGVIGYE